MLILKLINNEPFAPGELYDALGKKGGHGYELDAGLGKAFQPNNPLKKIMDDIFTIDHKKKTVAIKDIEKLFVLADFWSLNGPFELPSDWPKQIGKETRNKHNKSAILLLLALNHLSAIAPKARTKEQNNNIKQSLESLHTLFTFKDLLNRKENDQNTLLEITTKIENLQKKDVKKLHRPIPLSEQKIIAIPTQKKEEKILSVEPLPLDETVAKLLKETSEQGKDEKDFAVKKEIQKTFFIKKTEGHDFQPHKLQMLLAEMVEHQNGLKKHTLFTTIRTERGKLRTEAEGNTRTWQQMVSATKRELLMKLKRNHMRESINDKRVMSTKKYNELAELFSTHTGRFFTFSDTNSFKEFERSFCEDDKHTKKILTTK